MQQSRVAEMQKSPSRRLEQRPVRANIGVPIQPAPSRYGFGLSSRVSALDKTSLDPGSAIDAASNISSPTSAGPKNFSASSNSDTLAEQQPIEEINEARQHPPQRRSHTKSRAGCYTCKGRRIKVQSSHS
jgi:hypothetical protein